jgi:hypothetical protein
MQYEIFGSLQSHFIIRDYLHKVHKLGTWSIKSFENNLVNLHAVLLWLANVLQGNLGSVQFLIYLSMTPESLSLEEDQPVVSPLPTHKTT